MNVNYVNGWLRATPLALCAVTFIRAPANALLDRGRAARRWAGRRGWRTVAAMMHRTVRVAGPVAAVLAAAIAVGGCGGGGATAGASSAHPAFSAAATSTAVPAAGPPAPDAACAAARKAEQTLQARQGKDQASESAIDRDFTEFASALNAAARHATHPATARAMTALADDYSALVASQSGAAQLPSVATMQSDGAAFDRACP